MPLEPGVPTQVFHLVPKDLKNISEPTFILKLRCSQKHPDLHLLLKNLAPWAQWAALPQGHNWQEVSHCSP